MARTHAEIVEGLKSWVESDKEWLISFARDHSDELRKILDTPFENLPLLIGDEDISENENLNLIYQARLQGTPIDGCDVCSLLTDIDMDMDAYAALLNNDGQLQALAHALELLEEKELAADASRWVYRD